MPMTPLDLLREPPGSPAGGRFAPKKRRPPAGPLSDSTDATTAGALQAEYRRLWALTEANHRQNAYLRAEEVARDSDDHRELAVLSRFAKPGITEAVAQNPHTPASVLHEIAVNQRDTATDESRRLAVMHPNCSPATIRAVWAHRGTPDFEGRAADVVTRAPACPLDILERAAADGDPHARRRLES